MIVLASVPHDGIQRQAFRVLNVQVDDGDTCISLFTAHEYPVIHSVYKVEVSCQPVDGHMLHIYMEKTIHF